MTIRNLCASTAGMLILAAVSVATTPPALKLSDDLGNIVTIESTGAVTFGGTCVAGVTCKTIFVDTSVAGEIQWVGKIGNFSLSSNTGQTKPLQGAYSMDLGLS